MAVNFNKFTIKAQEAIQQATEITSNYENQQIEADHLFAALIERNEGVTVSILKKIGANTDFLKIKTNEFIEKLPKVSSAGQQFISQELNQVLEESTKIAGQLKDEYVSVEHILIAISESNSKLGDFLRAQGVTKSEILNALKDIRGTQRVTGQDPEDTYQSLKKYGRDLNELARKGKLDPVIGRDEEIRRVIHILSRRTQYLVRPASRAAQVMYVEGNLGR